MNAWKEVITIISILTPIICVVGAWVKWSIKHYLKDIVKKEVKKNNHCCLTNGCLKQFKKVIKEVVKEEMKQ